jgi:hypothetical protein
LTLAPCDSAFNKYPGFPPYPYKINRLLIIEYRYETITISNPASNSIGNGPIYQCSANVPIYNPDLNKTQDPYRGNTIFQTSETTEETDKVDIPQNE